MNISSDQSDRDDVAVDKADRTAKDKPIVAPIIAEALAPTVNDIVNDSLISIIAAIV